jgi:hypothetical protein
MTTAIHLGKRGGSSDRRLHGEFGTGRGLAAFLFGDPVVGALEVAAISLGRVVAARPGRRRWQVIFASIEQSRVAGMVAGPRQVVGDRPVLVGKEVIAIIKGPQAVAIVPACALGPVADPLFGPARRIVLGAKPAEQIVGFREVSPGARLALFLRLHLPFRPGHRSPIGTRRLCRQESRQSQTDDQGHECGQWPEHDRSPLKAKLCFISIRPPAIAVGCLPQSKAQKVPSPKTADIPCFSRISAPRPGRIAPPLGESYPVLRASRGVPASGHESPKSRGFCAHLNEIRTRPERNHYVAIAAVRRRCDHAR